MRHVIAAAFCAASLLISSATHAQTIYPIDRAEMAAGARFDLKVEFPGKIDPARVAVTLNGKDHAALFGRPATFIEREDNKDQSALMLRDVALPEPGTYTVKASDGSNTSE